MSARKSRTLSGSPRRSDSEKTSAASRACVAVVRRAASAESVTFWGSTLSRSPPKTGSPPVNQNGRTVSGFGGATRYDTFPDHAPEAVSWFDGFEPSWDEAVKLAVTPSSVYFSHGDRLPVLETWTRRFRELVVVRARSRTSSGRIAPGWPDWSPVVAASTSSSTRTSPWSGSNRGVVAFSTTEKLTGALHPNRSGSSLCAANDDWSVNDVWLAKSRPPSAPPNSPNPSSVNESRAFTVATSASATLAVRNPLAPPLSS